MDPSGPGCRSPNVRDRSRASMTWRISRKSIEILAKFVHGESASRLSRKKPKNTRRGGGPREHRGCVARCKPVSTLGAATCTAAPVSEKDSRMLPGPIDPIIPRNYARRGNAIKSRCSIADRESRTRSMRS